MISGNTKTVHAVLGADGQIGRLLAQELIAQGKRVVVVGRDWTKRPFGDAPEYRQANVMDVLGLSNALKGCQVVYSLLGLPYSTDTWRQLWVTMTKNVLAATSDAAARLIFLDNVYAYGLVQGEMTEATPYNPCSQKGQVRAEAARLLEQAMHEPGRRIIVARSADFIGPGAASSVVGARFFRPITAAARGVRRTEWLGDPATRHTYNFTLDNAKALSLLSDADDSFYNQTWHLPTSRPITGVELGELISRAAGCHLVLRPVHGWQLRLVGLFVPMAREQAEMQYQVENDYLFSDQKFMAAFPDFKKTDWPAIIDRSLEFFKKQAWPA